MPFVEGTSNNHAADATAQRIALVIGNGRYVHASPLENPANDARGMAAALARLNFTVISGFDLDLKSMGDALATFESALRGNPKVATLFYAGHGLQVRGRNYLIPIDADISEVAHLSTRALQVSSILEPMTENANASILFLDACRDNPFARSIARSLGDQARGLQMRNGLAKMEKATGTFIAFATAPDCVAFDGQGVNSPFTGALLAHLDTPNQSVSDMMIVVRNLVLAETNGKQEPWDQSSLRERFCFASGNSIDLDSTTQSKPSQIAGASNALAASVVHGDYVIGKKIDNSVHANRDVIIGSRKPTDD